MENRRSISMIKKLVVRYILYYPIFAIFATVIYQNFFIYNP